MPASDIKEIQKSVIEQGHRIKNLEDHISDVLPPLLEKFDNNAQQMHELCLSINDLVNQVKSQTKETEKLHRKFDKLQERHDILQDEVVENRILVKAVKGLGSKMLFAGLSVIGVAVVIVMTGKA